MLDICLRLLITTQLTIDYIDQFQFEAYRLLRNNYHLNGEWGIINSVYDYAILIIYLKADEISEILPKVGTT